MKILITLIFPFLLLLSCNKVDPEIKEPNDFSPLVLSTSLDFLPLDRLRNNTQVVFVNKHGDKKVCDIIFEEGVQTKAIDDKEYKAEYLYIKFIDSVNQDFGFSVFAGMNYYGSDSKDYAEFVLISINAPFNNNYFPAHININTQEDGFFFAIKAEGNINILGKSFSDVIFVDYSSNQESFSKLYYNKKSGIVGFEGAYREMWVLDAFIKK